MSMRMEGKTVLITGGGTGIGEACARLFSQSGAYVAVMGRRIEPLRSIADEIGGIAVQGDTSVQEDCEAAVRKTVDTYGGLDCLVASAGIMVEGSVTEVEKQQWDKIMDVNLNGVMLINRACIPEMQKRPGGGAIVNVASLGALFAPGHMAGYIAGKTALIGLTRSLAVDYGPHIRANALCPGWVLTPMSEEEMESYGAARQISTEEAIEHATRYLPLKRMASPEEIAKCAEFLCSDDSSFITGTTLVADGGSSAVDVGYISLG